MGTASSDAEKSGTASLLLENDVHALHPVQKIAGRRDSAFEGSLYHFLNKANHLTDPSHPSIADEAWYWPKCILHSG